MLIFTKPIFYICYEFRQENAFMLETNLTMAASISFSSLLNEIKLRTFLSFHSQNFNLLNYHKIHIGYPIHFLYLYFKNTNKLGIRERVEQSLQHKQIHKHIIISFPPSYDFLLYPVR